MRIHTIVVVALLSQGFVLPAWASSPAQGIAPAQESVPPSLNAPRQKPAPPPVPPRGQLLYENHCMSCHESVVHVRTRQEAKSLPELRAKVLQWAAFMRLNWGTLEVDDVVGHLNQAYYKFETR